MRNLPPLEDYLKAAEGPGVIKSTSLDGKYVKFKYTDHTIFSDGWDIVTLNARGHVFRLSDGECVLRPWSKFFNYSELKSETGQDTKICSILKGIPGLEPHFNLDDPHLATDKLDGSLLIAGIVDGRLLATTSGSFTAWQGMWARDWLLANAVNTKMVPRLTYMFEIIADDDLHPIRYDYEGCVLTGIIENATGKELPYEDLQNFASRAGIRVTEQVVLENFDETVKYVRSLPPSKEGLVLTYADGFKMKLKGPEFLAMQKLFHGLSEKSLIATFDADAMKFPEETRKTVPEEFTELIEFMDAYEVRFRNLYYRVLGFGGDCIMRRVPMGREVYELARTTFGDMPEVTGVACTYARRLDKTAGEDAHAALVAKLRADVADALGKNAINKNKEK